MHELSIAMSLVEQVDEAARREGASRVVSIIMSLGKLSGVEREQLEFCFPLASEGSLLDGAQLIIEEEPARIRCLCCAVESVPEPPFLLCEKCSSSQVEVISGRDLAIRSMEIE